MKKIVLFLLIIISFLINVTGCNKKSDNDSLEEGLILDCFVSELANIIRTKEEKIMDISLDKVTDKEDRVAYYKGAISSSQNMYIILKMNITYELEVAKDFEMYFSRKYPFYQRFYVASEDIYIYLHTDSNDVDFSKVENKCISNTNKDKGSMIPYDTFNSLNKTTKVVIKQGDNELGTIKNKEIIDKILSVISSARISGDAFLCDGNSFDFEMYNDDNVLIDTIYLWHSGKRLIPSSIHNGCSYYTVSDNFIDLRKIIEDETDYVFYGIHDYREDYSDNLELVYENDKYEYYLNCKNSDEVLITFDLSGLTMKLKDAINNGYIDPDKLLDYNDLIVRKVK